MVSKMTIFRYILLALVLLIPSTLALAGSDDAPPWLKQAAQASIPQYDKEVPAVVLLNDQSVTVYVDGRVETTTNYAVRVLTSEGKGYANASAPYLSNSGKVKEIHAWMVRPSGEIKRYGKDDTADVISDADDVYNELRLKQILGERDAVVGSVFGYTTTVEEHSVFGDDSWLFQHRIPTVLSRYSLTVPTGWKISSKLFNHASFDPVVSGSTYVWELKDLKPIRPERLSPAIVNLAPRLVVGFVPPPGTSTVLRSYSNWAEVSSWLTELHDPQATLDDAIATKVQELTANAKTELDKIRAVGKYVQNIQYISIDIGLGKGNGMRPHSASQVFAKSYGDCKDKANLMRTMLKALHITSYPLAIYLGDRDYVRQDWASLQFNHCIIAIKVSNDTQAPTIIEHPVLGRLLIFDATSDTTPVGDLPDDEQGSFALLIAGDKGGILRMPVTPPEANQLERKADVALSGDGSVTAQIHERFIGQSAVTARQEYRGVSKPEFSSMIQSWVSRGATAAQVSKVEPTDNMTEGRFGLDVEFTAAHYAQLMQEKLLVFRPAIVARSEFLAFNEPTRTQPIVLSSRSYRETVNITLPAGFDVDELPDAVKIATSFGTYSASYQVTEGKLEFKRSLIQNAGTIPSDQYSEVKGFYERIRKAEQTPVVLAKK